MKLTAKQITTTGILLAICIVSQIFKNISVFITGPIINACLILAVLGVGLGCGVILAVITPVTAFLITGSPLMAAIPAIIPSVMAGNIILVICVYLLHKKWNHKGALAASMALGTVGKAAFMGILIAGVLIPNFLPEGMVAAKHTAQLTFSLFQLITAAIGSVYAYLIWIPLKKVAKEA